MNGLKSCCCCCCSKCGFSRKFYLVCSQRNLHRPRTVQSSHSRSYRPWSWRWQSFCWGLAASAPGSPRCPNCSVRAPHPFAADTWSDWSHRTCTRTTHRPRCETAHCPADLSSWLSMCINYWPGLNEIHL